jgi:hypothetical protein
MSHRFGTSAPKAENGFVAGQIVSSARVRRNIRDKKPNDFNAYGLRQTRFGPCGTELNLPRLSRHAAVEASRRAHPARRLSCRDECVAPQAFSPVGENR